MVADPIWTIKKTDWEVSLPILAQSVLSEFDWDRPVEVTIKLTTDAEIQDLNRRYRGKDKPTNVLSFVAMDEADIQALPEGAPFILGDIALAFETVEREALEQDKPFSHHVNHLVVHGLLHVLGYDHETDEDAAEMESLEIAILNQHAIPNPYKE
jgi:probable rRNA maturation factor